MSDLSHTFGQRIAEILADASEDTITSVAESLSNDDEVQRKLRALAAKTAQKTIADLDSDATPEPQFTDVFEFVDKLLSRIYPVTEIRKDEVNWSPNWPKHEAVVLRLSALWWRYEQLRIEEPNTFMETFLRVHADYHMRYLMRDGGLLADNKRRESPTTPLQTDLNIDPGTDETDLDETDKE